MEGRAQQEGPSPGLPGCSQLATAETLGSLGGLPPAQGPPPPDLLRAGPEVQGQGSPERWRREPPRWRRRGSRIAEVFLFRAARFPKLSLTACMGNESLCPC